MSAPKSYRVVVIEWLAHEAVLTADTPELAKAQARAMWDDNAERDVFSFSDSGIDGVEVEEL
jgi:hypothetical protein